MFLVTTIKTEFFFIAQNTVKAGKHLFSGKLTLVVCFGNFKHEQHTFDVFDDINSLVVTPRHVGQDEYNGQPDVPLQKRVDKP